MVEFLRYCFILDQITSMRWVSFFARFVYICNICFLISLLFQYLDIKDLPQWLIGTLLVLGWFPFGTLVNFIFLVIVAYLFLARKTTALPVVVTLMNIFIFVFQVFYYLFS